MAKDLIARPSTATGNVSGTGNGLANTMLGNAAKDNAAGGAVQFATVTAGLAITRSDF